MIRFPETASHCVDPQKEFSPPYPGELPLNRSTPVKDLIKFNQVFYALRVKWENRIFGSDTLEYSAPGSGHLPDLPGIISFPILIVPRRNKLHQFTRNFQSIQSTQSIQWKTKSDGKTRNSQSGITPPLPDRGKLANQQGNEEQIFFTVTTEDLSTTNSLTPRFFTSLWQSRHH